MTYGYNQGDSGGSHKQALNSDAAASERLRIEAAKKAHDRQIKDRLKQQLTDLERKRDSQKLELSRHQVELRRLQTEVEHESRSAHDVESILKQLAEKEHSLKGHVSDAEQDMEALTKDIAEKKKESDSATTHLKALEAELQHVQQKINVQKGLIYEIGTAIQKKGLAARQVDLVKHKNEVDAERAKSERMYKEKDVDNKRRALDFLQQKMQHELVESQRVGTELSKIETEIRFVESKLK
jgi:chromosome segregation ATPase